jgi:hypothetical protein
MADGATFQSGNSTGLAANTVIATEDYSLGGTVMKHQRVKVALGPVDSGDYDLTGNEDVTLLASAARTASVNSAQQTTPSAKGVLFTLDVTSSTSAKTLSLKIQAKDPVSGNWVDIYDFGVICTSGGSAVTKAALLYPDADDTDFAGAKALKGNLPRNWRAVVTPNDATSWTYSLGASLLY